MAISPPSLWPKIAARSGSISGCARSQATEAAASSTKLNRGSVLTSCFRLSLDVCQTEDQSEAVQHLAEPSWTQRADSVDQALAIDGPDLTHVHDARARKVRFAFSKADVPRHGRQAKVGRYGGDHGRSDRAPVEAIVLHDDCRALSVWF
jgi:hypothetical protein